MAPVNDSTVAPRFGSFSADALTEEHIDLRKNSISALRLLLASLVLVHHAFQLPGFGADPIERLSRTHDFGILAVDGFFLLSGLVIAASLARLRSPAQFFWHRFLRIMPGYWGSLLLTTFVLFPLLAAWVHRPYFGTSDGPLHYVLRNLVLTFHQGRDDVAGLFAPNPFPFANGSVWTLFWEVLCYLALFIGSAVGFLRWRKGIVLALFLILCALGFAVVGLGFLPIAELKYPSMLLHFSAGVVVYRFRHQFCWKTWVALVALAIGVLALAAGVFYYVSPFVLPLVLMRLARSHRLAGFDRPGDFSYGLYIYAFPVQQAILLATDVREPWSFALFSFALTLPLACLSWFMIERPALRFKGLFA